MARSVRSPSQHMVAEIGKPEVLSQSRGWQRATVQQPFVTVETIPGCQTAADSERSCGLLLENVTSSVGGSFVLGVAGAARSRNAGTEMGRAPVQYAFMFAIEDMLKVLKLCV